jgi:hypothetical protein
MKAQVKLEDLRSEANSRKSAAHHLDELYEIKNGAGIEQVPLTEMEMRWNLLWRKNL